MVGSSAPSVPPFRRRDADRPLVSYAQVGEDIRLARVLWDRPPGCYVDVGAGDPVTNSVTKLFYDAGWHGVNVEPGPVFGRLRVARPRDVNLKLLVAADEGERDFWVCDPYTELSSFDRPDPSTLPPGSRLKRQRIASRRLDTILEEHADPAIDFLKIDVEGAEREVLDSLDLRRFRPLVVIVEAIEPITLRPSHEAWEPRVLDAGYVLAAFDGVNRFYVTRERADLRQVLGYPLSLLDRCVSAAEGFQPTPPAADFRSADPPSLADELASVGVDRPLAAERPLTVVLDGVDEADFVSRILPAGSSLIGLAPDGLRPAGGEDSPRWAVTLAGVSDVARSEPHDVLIVSDTALLTQPVLEELQSTLADDSACATASAERRTFAAAPGVPAPTVEFPRRGVVLVHRDHLLLALDEAALLAADDVGLLEVSRGEGLVDAVLATLVRPGFVHRACGRRIAAPPAVQAPVVGRRRERGASIVLDGRCLHHPMSGTQVQLLGLLGGLVRAGANVAVLAPTEVHPTVAPSLEPFEDTIPFVERSGVGWPDVFHRPFQIGSLEGLADCLSVGKRLVVTHLDLILDRTVAYVTSRASWDRYRATTVAALSSADEIGFLSRHAALDAASDGMLDLYRANVVPLGVDHLGGPGEDDGDPRHPLAGRPYVLVLGNAYWHKNRVFAVRLVQWLIERHGWEGGLLLVGGHPAVGSSRLAEDALVRRVPSLAGRVVDLGHVSETDRHAHLGRAGLVLYPSLYEGFGLIPFEAAAVGRPCAYTYRSSMREFLPAAGALPSFDLEEVGPFLLELLESPAASARVVASVREAATGLSWDRAAASYIEVYGRALEREPRGISRSLLSSVSTRSWSTTEKEAQVLDVYRRRPAFRLAADTAIRAGAAARRAVRRRGGPRSSD